MQTPPGRVVTANPWEVAVSADGRQLYVVRVANGARGAMLCLPASGSALVLRAVEPGSTEQIRAAVDYDGVDETAEMVGDHQ